MLRSLLSASLVSFCFFFFFNDTATTEIYTLSLHDALPISRGPFSLSVGGSRANSTDWLIDGVDNNELTAGGIAILSSIDRKSTRLNSSHLVISYAVFCLKKKKRLNDTVS